MDIEAFYAAVLFIETREGFIAKQENPYIALRIRLHIIDKVVDQCFT